MKRFKKGLALFLVLIMAVSAWGCKKDNDSKNVSGDAKVEDKDKKEEGDKKEPEESKVPENEVIGDENVKDPFYVYSWNTEISDRLEYFKKAYPEYAKRIVYVNTGGNDYYQDKIDPLLSNPDNKQYPDLVALEADYILKYTASEHIVPVEELGVKSDDMKNMYPYTVDIATVDGKVKALSWQATPGVMMYRRSLAKKYLGTDEPEKVQEFFKDWDTMMKSARTINDKSKGKTKILSGTDDVARVFLASRKQPWIKDDVLTIDDKMLEYMDYAKILEKEELTNKTAQWSDAWNANTASDNTFAYMGCTWFLHWTLKANCGGKAVGEGTYGDWAMIQGPQPYYWGGTWLGATKGCSDPELAGLIMKALTCDTKIMEQMCEKDSEYVNNKEAINNLISKGFGEDEFLGGQNYLKVFAPLADEVTVPLMCGEDFYMNSGFNNQVTEYAKGKKDKDTAIADFKKAMTDTFTYISAE